MLKSESSQLYDSSQQRARHSDSVRLVRVRIYKKEQGILRRLVMRKNLGKQKNEVKRADIIRQLIKEA